MVYIKKMIMHGFKSFGKRTEVVFDKGINTIVGPNGSGKSNVSDSLCFVLGRLSAKSMRASKSQNMIFMGSKFVKPAHEASVELVFDNSDKKFAIESNEICLKRIVRRNGQGIYKINDEVKTRAEILELLAQAGIDPYGFNLVLQGQIQSIVKMHPEERRKIIEEVAGISIYETRKEKSMKELEKTDEKLKEIGAILRERRGFLNNLDRERSQALKFKELETLLKRIKASILQKKIDEKQKELDLIIKSVDEKTEMKEKLKEKANNMQKDIDELTNKINQINRHIQQATGLEQEKLHTQIADLKAELEGLRVRNENYENRKAEIGKRIEEIKKAIPELEKEIEELKTKSPLMAKKAEELRKKKEELAVIEDERKKVAASKAEFISIKERIRDKESQLARASAEAESAVKQIEEYSIDFMHRNEEECNKAIVQILELMSAKRNEITLLNKEEIEKERAKGIADSEVIRCEKIKNDVEAIDICPLCQSKISSEHKNHVNSEAERKISEAHEKISKIKDALEAMNSRRNTLLKEIRDNEDKCSSARIELMKHRSVKERKNLLKKYLDDEKSLKEEIKALEERRKTLENKTEGLSIIEEKYRAKMLEIEEISSRTEENVDESIMYKGREIERCKELIKNSINDLEELEETINEVKASIENKAGMLEKKEGQEKELNDKFKKMFEERENLQKSAQDNNLSLSEVQSEIRGIDEQVNYLKIGKARLDAEKEALSTEISEFSGLEILKMSMNVLAERLQKTQESLREIGSINMRALEVYESVKKEYDVVEEKANILSKEKDEIMKIIEEIDKKKTRTFMRTFNAMNDLFTSNFAKLYTKGVAFLEIENKEDIFAGGIDIVIRLAKGKYFDVSSLSGGEQTLVALSLLFAIQEHKPYHFYVFDEIDAALDKRNSERLAALLCQYMKSGQYIVITHNDAIITNSDVLYGVSMHDGISKVLSLKLDERQKAQNAPAQNALEQNQEQIDENTDELLNRELLKENQDLSAGQAQEIKELEDDGVLDELKNSPKDVEIDAGINDNQDAIH